jgi:hypothetical protein
LSDIFFRFEFSSVLFTGLRGSLNFARKPFFNLREKPVHLGLVVANLGQSLATFFEGWDNALGLHEQGDAGQMFGLAAWQNGPYQQVGATYPVTTRMFNPLSRWDSVHLNMHVSARSFRTRVLSHGHCRRQMGTAWPVESHQHLPQSVHRRLGRRPYMK